MAKAKKKTAAKKPAKAKKSNAVAEAKKSARAIQAQLGNPQPNIPTEPGERTSVPFAALVSSPLNPRKHFDDEALATLADSIHAEGVLQNLTVRPYEGAKNCFEIAAGERRHRAIGLLIKQGRADRDFMVPVLVKPMTDVQLLEVAMAENMARGGLTAMEEARGFAELRARDVSTDDIAARTGVSKRTVQSRLTLVDKLAPAVIKALEAGDIKVTQARTLAMTSHKKQREMLDGITRGWLESEDELLSEVTKDMPGTHLAIFPMERYTGEIADEEGTDRTYFVDEAQFLKLQEVAIQEKVGSLEGKGTAVKVLRADKNEYFDSHNWKKKPKNSAAVTIIEVGRGLDVKIHPGMVKNTARDDEDLDLEDGTGGTGTTGSTKADDDADGANAFTKAHRAHANRRKTFVLQDAISSNPFTAMRLVCARLLDNYAFSMVRLARERNPSNFAEPLATSPNLREALKRSVSAFPSETQAYFSDNPEDAQGAEDARYDMEEGDKEAHGVAIWAALIAMTDGEIANLFSGLIAAQVGIWGEVLGCDEVEIAVATSLGLAGAEARHGLTLQEADVEGLRKSALLGTRYAIGCEDAAGAKAGELKDRLIGNIQTGDTGFVLPTLAFLTPEQTGAEIARVLALPAQSKAA